MTTTTTTTTTNCTRGRELGGPTPARRHDGGTEVGILVRDLAKNYGAFRAVDDVSFTVPAGQLVALLGPSGSGKSTILRIIAGLEHADSGGVELTGEDAASLPVQRRGVGFVFQHYALFRHMTVAQNIAFGLEVRKLPAAEVRARVAELLDLIQMSGYAGRYPSQLSGGQRQRVALARALAPRPRVLLLDEPFGALDSRVRDELRTWLRRLHDEVHMTSLFVTHDQQEAFEVADQVVVLNRGRVEQMGPPQELYERPCSPFVAEFLGSVNVLRARSLDGTVVLENGLPAPGVGAVPDGPVSIYVRPHDLDLARRLDGHPSWPGRVRRLVPLGGLVRLDVRLRDGTDLRIQVTADRHAALALAPGDEVFVTPRDLKVFRHPDPSAADYVI